MKTRKKDFQIGQVVRCDGATFSPAYGRIRFLNNTGAIVEIFSAANDNYKVFKDRKWPFNIRNLKVIPEAKSRPAVHCFDCGKPTKNEPVYLGMLLSPITGFYTLVGLHTGACYERQRGELIDDLV